MASIPLHCNICPSEPKFSDSSHLLTHIASKGHLSHYFKCQVRSRQDENVRNKVEVYDRWYTEYEIEKLLSQRMIAKQTKPRATTKSAAIRKQDFAKSSTSKEQRKPKGRRQSKKAAQDTENAAEVQSTDVLDPQLSVATDQHTRHASQHTATGLQAPVPQMSDYPLATPKQSRPSNGQSAQSHLTHGLQSTPDYGDLDDDVFNTFIRSPTASAQRPTATTSISTQLLQAANDASAEEDVPVVSPVLKGIIYPGMSLFDAASRQAQRLRNQRKDVSILEQLELDAAAIEPMEHIYWPEGDLKKSRIITGNVESSPIKEETPPPARLITFNPGNALGELSTNVPVYIGRRGRGTSSQTELGSRLDIMADTALQTLKSVYPKIRPVSPSPTFNSDYDTGVLGSPLRLREKPNFQIYCDPDESKGLPSFKTAGHTREKLDASLPIRSSPHRSSPWRSLSNNLAPSPFSCSPVNPFGPAPGHRTHRQSSNPILTPPSTGDKENQPPFNGANSAMEHSESPQRVTQRYFSVVGDNAPQFYSSVPPGMDFGGLFGRTFHGPSANPLNAFHQRSYFQPDYLEAEPEDRSSPARLGSKKGKSVSFQSS